VITSWKTQWDGEGYAPVEQLADRGITSFDYYFLNPGDLEFIATLVGRDGADGPRSSSDLACALCPRPEENTLDEDSARRIDELRERIHADQGVGAYASVHFRAVATNFPGLASCDNGTREKAVKAVKVAIRVAERIDADIVEVVCGVTAGRGDTGLEVHAFIPGKKPTIRKRRRPPRTRKMRTQPERMLVEDSSSPFGNWRSSLVTEGASSPSRSSLVCASSTTPPVAVWNCSRSV